MVLNAVERARVLGTPAEHDDTMKKVVVGKQHDEIPRVVFVPACIATDQEDAEVVSDAELNPRNTTVLVPKDPEALEEIGDMAKHILVDVHAEATSDKQVLGRYLDGKVTAVLGTHTHVPTADAHIMPNGTAFQCDVGMSGPYDSIIGRDVRRVMQTTRSFEPCHFHVATGDVRLCGAIVDSTPAGRAKAISRFELAIND